MALDVKTMKRGFSFQKNGKTIELSDPELNMSPDEVLAFYANTYPELTTATVQGPEIKNDEVVYTFKTTIGTKG